MKRFVISQIKKRIDNLVFVLPAIEEKIFNSPKRFGAYCAEDGTLWTSLSDEKYIFETRESAEKRLNEIFAELKLAREIIS